MGAKYDFSGWVTRNDLKCSDGRTIRANAFADQDGARVPLVWQHQHADMHNVLGHVDLENRAEGVYGYARFNATEDGRQAKELVEHGDITKLSIYANNLKQSRTGDVMHGAIREVSLVYSGANPGAYIDFVALQHSEEDDTEIGEAWIFTGEDFELAHADKRKPEDEEVEEDASAESEASKKTEEPAKAPKEEQQNNNNTEDAEMANNENKTVQDVFDTLNEDQKKAVYALIGYAVEHADELSGKGGDDNDDNDEVEHSDFYGGHGDMKYNTFEAGAGYADQGNTLTHDEEMAIFSDAKKYGTLKDSFLAHAEEYGIENIDYLFPEARALGTQPEFIERDKTWVNVVMNGVHRSPFSRIKSVFANITEDDARARGYFKGNLKKNEVFTLLKRVTTPTTIYKKQQLDRDDTVDITDFDVVAWIKSEMRGQLDEEIARAILFGDGRDTASDDKINEQCIRPIVTDGDIYTIKKTVAKGATDDETMNNLIKVAIKAKADYKGSGNATFFTSDEYLADLLLLETTIGEPKFKTDAELAARMRVKNIVTVPSEILPQNIYGVIVNLADYNVGADKGGAINMFDDFDIDYNQMKYLIETRCSGALVKPYSAIVLKKAE